MSNTSPLQLVNGENLIDNLNSSTEIVSNYRELRSSNSCGGGVVVGGVVVGGDNNIAADYQVGEHRTAAAAAARAAYNMVAAMNEDERSSSATNSVRTTTTTTTASSTTDAVNDFRNVSEDSKAGILGFPEDFDHMYASMTDGDAPASATSALGVSPLRGNEARQNDLTEVKHLKELLLLHLDLIQQQSEQIVTKDKLLAALRQENETLKLRLERMDRRVNLQKHRSETAENSLNTERINQCSPPNVNIIQSLPSTSEHQKQIQSELTGQQYNESFKIRLNTSSGIPIVKQEHNNVHETKNDMVNDNTRHDWDSKKKRRSDPTPVGIAGKRKRGASCSSTIINDQCTMVRESSKSLGGGGGGVGVVVGGDGVKKVEKKIKSLLKRESYLTTEDHYYTAVGDTNYSLSMNVDTPQETSQSLEVPNWRIKVYTSCYTMEGTENLDDEIFNKRHLKLENDERRRKRWDVQRIREQRHIEKLKQRQERQNHQATCYNTNHSGPCSSSTEEETVKTLWPDLDQIQSLQVDAQLPVNAFGAAVPGFSLSDFILPWQDMIKSKERRHQRVKRSTGRRKSCRR